MQFSRYTRVTPSLPAQLAKMNKESQALFDKAKQARFGTVLFISDK